MTSKYAADQPPHARHLRLPSHGRWRRWTFGWLWFLGLASGLEAAQSVVVVLDDSGSMRQWMRTDGGRIPRIQAAKEALSKVVQGLPDDSQLGILLLNHGGRGNPWLVPLGPLSAADVLPKIAQIQADGGTPLGNQMKNGADALLDLRQKQLYGEYRLLVITDGEASDANLLDAYLPDILSRGLTLDVIGVDMTANHSLASRAHSYRKADDAASFEKALKEVFAESTGPADDQGANDFELIADLPDELARTALATLAIPRNNRIGFVAHPDASDPAVSIPIAPWTASPSMPVQPPSSPIERLIGFLSALPCCLTIVIVFVLVIAFSQNKNKKNRR